MKTTIEALDGNKIKLSIEVDETEFERYLDGAFRKISTQIRIPGFRQGKAPRQLIEAQIGKDAARSQAIERLKSVSQADKKMGMFYSTPLAKYAQL